MGVKLTGAVEEVGLVEDGDVQVDATQLIEMEIGGIRETLIEVFSNVKPSFVKSGAVKTVP